MEKRLQQQETSKAKQQQTKKAAYRTMIRPELADELYNKIVQIIIKGKKYKDQSYSASQLAKDLNTNTRYLSAVINSRFGMNYSCLLNEHRVKEALRLLVDKRYQRMTVEDISNIVGFSNRQSFYAAFSRITGETPSAYRNRCLKLKE